MRINDTVKATLMKVCFIHWIWHLEQYLQFQQRISAQRIIVYQWKLFQLFWSTLIKCLFIRLQKEGKNHRPAGPRQVSL